MTGADGYGSRIGTRRDAADAGLEAGDAELVALALAGHQAGFARLLERYRDSVFRLVRIYWR